MQNGLYLEGICIDGIYSGCDKNDVISNRLRNKTMKLK